MEAELEDDAVLSFNGIPGSSQLRYRNALAFLHAIDKAKNLLVYIQNKFQQSDLNSL